MNIMFLLIGVSLLAAMIFLILFIWAVKRGQYDDTYTPSVRILFDDDLTVDSETPIKHELDQKTT
ncbi:MAG: cbb3-type cytochrome oxidase assembly protein CcoS [Bacteroidia bacterium]|nr:cbb3-type cytochrome oxidase assembly protein CcoS [Bacteroidia bacterium]